MAIPTVFDLTFGCGHAGTVDASDRAADQRGAWIAYLSSKGMCPDCFEATRDKRRELARTQWIAGAAQKKRRRSVRGKPRWPR